MGRLRRRPPCTSQKERPLKKPILMIPGFRFPGSRIIRKLIFVVEATPMALC